MDAEISMTQRLADDRQFGRWLDLIFLQKLLIHDAARLLSPSVHVSTGSAGGADTRWALGIAQADHTPIDLIVVDDINRLPIDRPLITVICDVAQQIESDNKPF